MSALNAVLTHFIVQTASAPMPSKCWGQYRRVAVLEVLMPLASVAQISERAKGVVRVVQTWEKRNVGRTERCAYRRALAAAEELAEELNNAPARVTEWRTLLASSPEFAVLTDAALEAT